jgi:hypothetical protein
MSCALFTLEPNGLRHAHLGARRRQHALQVGSEPREIELLARAHGASVVERTRRAHHAGPG